MKPLHLFYENRRVGRLFADPDLHLDFQYDEEWLQAEDSFPLSISLPLQKDIHRHPQPALFLENLLPEDKNREAIEQTHRLAKGSPYLFLRDFGEDTAGAFVFSIHQTIEHHESLGIEIPLRTIQVAMDRRKPLYQLINDTYGAKFSLAGTQDKFCHLYQYGKLFAGTGSQPSTHIAKANLDFPDSESVFNEYFCMKLAEKVGISVAKVILIPQPALLIVERFDRISNGSNTRRLHQEDFCQAQGFSSEQKYEDRGGPGIAQNFQLIRRYSTHPIKDLESFLDWIAFNLIIGNNDSHSKNISFLYQGKKVRLAPFYDLLSTTVYERRFSLDFAFKIGDTRRYEAIRPFDVKALEESTGVRHGKFLKNMTRISKSIEKHVSEVKADLEIRAPASTIGAKIEHEIHQRLKQFREHGRLPI